MMDRKEDLVEDAVKAIEDWIKKLEEIERKLMRRVELETRFFA